MGTYLISDEYGQYLVATQGATSPMYYADSTSQYYNRNFDQCYFVFEEAESDVFFYNLIDEAHSFQGGVIRFISDKQFKVIYHHIDYRGDKKTSTLNGTKYSADNPFAVMGQFFGGSHDFPQSSRDRGLPEQQDKNLSVTVKWNRPADDEELTTSFFITVNG